MRPPRHRSKGTPRTKRRQPRSTSRHETAPRVTILTQRRPANSSNRLSRCSSATSSAACQCASSLPHIYRTDRILLHPSTTRILLMVRAIPRDKKVCAPAIVAKQSAPPGAHTDPTRTPAPCPRAPTIHLPFVTGSYYQNIMDENAQLEAVLGIFEARGLLDSTLFVYASDHGTEGKWTAYEAGLKVPLVVRWPAGGVQGGENSTALVSLLDIFPTFLEIAGAAQPAFDGLDGRSLLPLLTAPKLSHHKHVFSVATRQNIQQPSVFPSRSVRGARYKLIVNFNAKERNLGDAAGDTNVHSRHGRSYPREFIRLGADTFEDVSLRRFERCAPSSPPSSSRLLRRVHARARPHSAQCHARRSCARSPNPRSQPNRCRTSSSTTSRPTPTSCA